MQFFSEYNKKDLDDKTEYDDYILRNFPKQHGMNCFLRFTPAFVEGVKASSIDGKSIADNPYLKTNTALTDDLKSFEWLSGFLTADSAKRVDNNEFELPAPMMGWEKDSLYGVETQGAYTPLTTEKPELKQKSIYYYLGYTSIKYSTGGVSVNPYSPSESSEYQDWLAGRQDFLAQNPYFNI